MQADVELDGVTGLFGASGSGKSTLLRLIAGLERADDGHVRFAGKPWQDAGTFVPPHRRPVGYVFQDARLFRHLDVAGNLRFAARRRSDDGAGPQFDEVVAACDLDPLLDRDVRALSGGEQQRVALARTLLCGPRLLLFDEPLAALDAARKHDILPYIESLQARFGIPAIYVSHSMDEIVRLADRVIVLADGRVQARGPTVPVLDGLALPSAGRASMSRPCSKPVSSVSARRCT
ncbi:MAG: ATP-binding cassette domain-containing protein [Woeseiaceae bacterium]|nr:ATP-binding cassette domain-containing protein [Woeseiaceae bacterium]